MGLSQVEAILYGKSCYAFVTLPGLQHFCILLQEIANTCCRFCDSTQQKTFLPLFDVQHASSFGHVSEFGHASIAQPNMPCKTFFRNWSWFCRLEFDFLERRPDHKFREKVGEVCVIAISVPYKDTTSSIPSSFCSICMGTFLATETKTSLR